MEGYHQQREEYNQQAWEQARTIAYSGILPHLGRKGNGLTPEGFLPFPWDKQQKKKAANLQEVKQMLAGANENDPEEAERFLEKLDELTD